MSNIPDLAKQTQQPPALAPAPASALQHRLPPPPAPPQDDLVAQASVLYIAPESADGVLPIFSARIIGEEAVPATFRFDEHKDVIPLKTFKDVFTETVELNSGASAVCMSAVCRVTGEKVALKVFKEGKDHAGKRKPYSRSCFLEEAEIALRCRGHRNVIWTALPALKTEQEGYILISEWGNGSDMLDYYNQERNLTEEDIIELIQQMIRGLQHVHSCGYVHMDVKPENFVVSRQAEGTATVKLIDFGLAYRTGKLLPNRMSTCGGRVYYAPEKFPKIHPDEVPPGTTTATRHYSVQPSFDVWGLGVTMLSCMTSRMPWEVAYSTDPAYVRFQRFVREPQKFKRPPSPFGYLNPKWLDVFTRIFIEDIPMRITLPELLQLLEAEREGFLHLDVKKAEAAKKQPPAK